MLKVVMVEDSPVVAGRIRNMLNESGEISIVGEAFNSKEALVILKIMSPDIILVSLNLTAKNGISFLKEIRQLRPTIKMMVLSNQSETYFRNLCLESGADFFFDKSTEFEKIPGALAALHYATGLLR